MNKYDTVRGPARKKRRQVAAAQRQDEARKRTPAQQLSRLDELFGPGLGATKERARLEKVVRNTSEKTDTSASRR